MDQSRVRIASYNIRKARGVDMRRDPGRVIDVFNGLDADIVVLQEADLRLGHRKAALPFDLLEKHTDFKVAPVAENEVSIGWHGNGVLLRPGLRAVRVERIILPGLEPRGAVSLEIEGDVRFMLVATHMGLRRRDRRAQQARIMSAISSEQPVVIAGDFNEWSKSKGLEAFASRFKIHAPGRSFHAQRPISALDRIALSQDLTLTDAGVEDGELARRASDHLPIWGNVTFNAPHVSPNTR